MSRDETINDYIAEVLVRYFRGAMAQRFVAPSVRIHSSQDLLTQYWAISNPVQDLIRYLRNHIHELQSVLQVEQQIHRDTIRGRIDARLSQLLQRRTGQPTWTVCITPSRSFESGPNRVLSWVLNRARSILSHLEPSTWGASPNYPRAQEQLALLETIRRFEPIRHVLADATSLRPPPAQALLEATRSRRMIYRLASAALMYWRDIQAGNPEALRRLFNDTVLGPSPAWQRFELAVGLAAAASLSTVAKVPFQLGTIAPSSHEPFAVVGDLVLYWQSQTKHYVEPLPEESEKLVSEILEILGVPKGGDRPDFIVAEQKQQRVVSVFEVKYYENADDDGAGALRDAVQQVVRYSRGYRASLELRGLVESSVIALARTDSLATEGAKQSAEPWVVDLRSMLRGEFVRWARGVATEHRDHASTS